MKEDSVSNQDMAPVEQNHARDGRWSTNPSPTPRLQPPNQRYSAEVPVRWLDEQSQLIEQLICRACDTLGARHLDVRIHGPEQVGVCPTHHRDTVGTKILSAHF